MRTAVKVFFNDADSEKLYEEKSNYLGNVAPAVCLRFW